MFGKRPDGRRIKSLTPMFQVSPFIMTTRSDAQVFFEMDINVEPMEAYVKKNKEEHPELSYMSVVIASMARVLCEVPQVNRFVIDKRIYARKKVSINYVVLDALEESDPDETIVQLYFEEGDTIFDIAGKMNDATQNAKTEKADIGVERLLDIFMKMPKFLLGGLVGFLKWLDKKNALPKSVVEFSPFHTSLYITNMASLGIGSIYHHIYDFGTTSQFMAMGKRHYTPVYGKDGFTKTIKTMPFKFVGDERICSGYIYSKSSKLFEKYMTHPEILEEKTHIVKDVD